MAVGEEEVQPDDDEVLELRPEEDNSEIEGFSAREDLGFRLDSDRNVELLESSTVTWKALTNVNETKATIGLAADHAWEQALLEFDFIRTKLEVKCGTPRPRLNSLVNLIFGPESSVYKAFKDEGIFDDNEVFLQFLATFFMCCSHQMSTKQLFDPDSRINLEGAMGKSDYVYYWKKIGSASTPTAVDRNREMNPTGMLPFWMKLENAFNDYSRSLFINGFTGAMQVTVDDDKCHFNGNQYTAGLKVVRHTKDNRNGHTCHTMVHSYSQIPIQIAWERTENDSAEEATKRCFANGITPMAAQGAPGDLRHVRTGKDRGYWSKSLLHDYVMASGCRITAGTAKRQPCIPFNFQQKMATHDKRIDIPVSGGKTLFTAVSTSHGRKLYSIAYRNGTGGVTLGLSTEYGSKPEWELVPAKPSDMKWYDSDTELTTEEKLRKCFHPVIANKEEDGGPLELDDDFVDRLKSLGMRPLTTMQGTPEWFLLRRFSLTSSTTDRAIASCNGDEDWIQYTDSWRTIKEVLGAITAPVPEAADEDNDVTLQDPPSRNGATDDAGETAQEESKNEPDDAVLTLEGLLTDDAVVELARNQMAEDEIDLDGIVRPILVQLGHTLSKATSEVRKTSADLKAFEAWLDAAPQLKKKYFSMKPAGFITAANSLGIDVTALGNRKDALRKAVNDHFLANPDATMPAEEPTRPTTARANRAQRLDGAMAAVSGKNKLLHSVLRAGYLDPLISKAKKHTRRGHELECHIMRSCIRDHAVADTMTPARIKAACTAPLVKRNQTQYARDSIDFVACVEGEDECIGVEVKARIGNQRDQRETQHVADIRRLLGADQTPRQRKIKYFQVDAEAPEFATLVADTHEAVQVIHHAYVYGFKTVLLLVGNNNAEVLYGLFVTISHELIDAYGNVLKDIYCNTLEWLYSTTGDVSGIAPSDADLAIVLNAIKINDAPLDNHSFQMDVALWQDVNRNMLFPLPRLARILPLIFSFWNSIKGGSDATTNLLWHCQYSIPNRENQSAAVARMLNLCGVHIHRLLQLSTAKPNLRSYGNLKRFRDAASSRRSFKKSLNMIVGEMVTKPEMESIDEEPLTPVRPVNDSRARRSQALIEKYDLAMLQTNATPLRNVKARLEKLEARAVTGDIDAPGKILLERSKQCPGVPIFRIGNNSKKNGPGSRGRCAHCGSQTHNYCLLCKRWLCNKMSDNFDGKKQHVINPDGGSPIYLEPNCFYVNHRGVQEMAVKKFTKDNIAKL